MARGAIIILHLLTTTSFLLANGQLLLDTTDWNTIATSESSPGLSKSLLPDTVTLPTNLYNESSTWPYTSTYTAPIIGYYNQRLFIIDSTQGIVYNTLTGQNNPSWTPTDIPSDSVSIGGCATSKCFTQIDSTLYIIYDYLSSLVIYNLLTQEFEQSVALPAQFDSIFCLTNNATHLFAVGDNTNILIYELATGSFNFSADFLPNVRPFTCSLDSNNNAIYTFSPFGIFQYSTTDDTLSVIHDRLSFDSTQVLTALYSEPSTFSLTTSTDANTADGLIWIRYADQVLAYSSITDRFLNCRVQQTNTALVASTLYSLDGYLFEFGGAEYTEGGYTMFDRIVWIDNSFNDERFTLADWFYPGYAIAINYTEQFLSRLNDTPIEIGLSSFDFDVSSIHINMASDLFFDNDKCEVCYNTFDIFGTCGVDDGWCKSDGLRVELLSDQADSEEVDIRDIVYSIEATTSSDDVVNSARAGFICNSFPIYPVYLTLNVSLHASDDYFYLLVDYEYQCNGCSVDDFNDGELYAFESQISFDAEFLGISSNEVSIAILNQQSCVITDNSNNNEQQYNCSEWPLTDVSQIYFDADYVLSVSSSDTYLESSEIELDLSSSMAICPAGTGYDNETNSCSICEDGTFSLRSDSSACISCNGVSGISCNGGNSITVEYRYWVSGYRQSSDEYITLYEIGNNSASQDDDVLISHICAYGQCCDEINGCDYVTHFEDESLCSNRRDITTAMCTGCIADNYELFSTNDCGECDYFDNMWYLLGTFSIAFILVFYLAFCDAKPLDIMIDKMKHRHDEQQQEEEEQANGRQDEQDDDSSSLSSSDREDEDEDEQNNGGRKNKKRKQNKDMLRNYRAKSQVEMEFSFFVADSYIANSALIFQIFVVYFQAYAEILSSSGSRAYLSPIVNFFNLNFANDQIGSNGQADSDAGFCAIPFTESLGEILMTLIFPALMLFCLFIIGSFFNTGHCCRFLFCGSDYFSKPYVLIAFFRIWIILVGLVFRVLMQLITCTRFINKEEWEDEKWVQFYYNQSCFGAAWWVALFCFVILLMFFAQIYLKLFHQTNEERYSLHNRYTKLVQAYQPQYWYWEAVITTRRFILSMFVTLSFIGGGYSNLILCLILIFYLIAHLTVYPFKHKRNNRIESFCILSVLIGFIGINFEDIADSVFLSLFLGIVIFMPVLIAIYYLIKMCTGCYQYYQGNEQYFIDAKSRQSYEERLKMMQRRVLAKRESTRFNVHAYGDDDDDDDAQRTDVVLQTKPNGYGGQTATGGIEMATIAYAPPTNTAQNDDDNHSDTSCGLSE